MASENPVWPIVRRGKKGAAVIVFLHGFMGCKEDWLPVMDQLANSYDCIAFDLPGHGENLSIATLPSFNEVLTQMENERLRLNIRRWNVAGYSMGGRIALWYAIQHADVVSSLTLVSTSPGIESDTARKKRIAQDHVWSVFMVTKAADKFYDEWYDQPVFRSLRSKTELMAKLKQVRKAGLSGFMPNSLEDWGQGVMASAWEFLPGMKVPVLAVAGELDDDYCRTAGRLKNLLPGTQVAIVEDAGHTVHLEQPVVLSGLLEKFIKTG